MVSFETLRHCTLKDVLDAMERDGVPVPQERLFMPRAWDDLSAFGSRSDGAIAFRHATMDVLLAEGQVRLMQPVASRCELLFYPCGRLVLVGRDGETVLETEYTLLTWQNIAALCQMAVQLRGGVLDRTPAEVQA